jgi:hypothetical protein
MTIPIHFSLPSLKESRWYEYLIRFVLGGIATVVTGIISTEFGVSVGGLFLALPATLCASATLIEKHEIRRKHEAGLSGERRGQLAAALDAAGAGLGAFGMLSFGAVFWWLVETNVAEAFVAASLTWLAVSVTAWLERRKMRIVRARIPELLNKHHPAFEISGNSRWSRSHPYYVALADAYVQENYDHIAARCARNGVPLERAGDVIEVEGRRWCVYKFAHQLDAIMFWDTFDGRWIRREAFIYPERPQDLVKMK